MKYCNHCGNPLKPDARFCGKCGQLLKEEIKPVSVTPPQQPLCPKCGTLLVPGVKFCTVCGVAIQLATNQLSPSLNPVVANVPPVQASPPLNIKALDAGKSLKKKNGNRILVFAASAITVLAATVAAIYFFGNFEPKGSYSDLSALYVEEKYDQAKIDSCAAAVETIFLNGDTVKLAQILSPTTLEQKREFFSEIQPYMAAYGNDFKTRKFLYATARFAVYEFSSAKGTFTVDFCLGPDGTWKLMRF